VLYEEARWFRPGFGRPRSALEFGVVANQRQRRQAADSRPLDPHEHLRLEEGVRDREDQLRQREQPGRLPRQGEEKLHLQGRRVRRHLRIPRRRRREPHQRQEPFLGKGAQGASQRRKTRATLDIPDDEILKKTKKSRAVVKGFFNK
jgi:hypothetical protein